MRRRTRHRLPGALVAIALSALAAAACGVFAEQPHLATSTPLVEPNVLLNPGFEDGIAPWFAGESSEGLPVVQVTTEKARSGNLGLELRVDPAPEQTSAVSQAMQRIQGDVFPEFLSGYYFVDEWRPGEADPYIGVTLSIHGGNHPDGASVHELRLVLAGTTTPPIPGDYVFLNRDEPAIGEWTYFAYPVLEAVRMRLGWDPIGWESIDVSFELRYAGAERSAPEASRVYFDDLYLGPQRSSTPLGRRFLPDS